MGSRAADEEASNQRQEEEEIIWDSIAEEALKAIEDSYYSSSKRSLPDPNSDSPNERSMRRRLPNWACSSQTITTTSRQWRLSPPPCRQRYPSINFSGRIVYCRTAPEVESATAELLERMKEEGKLSRMPLGFDIEWRPTFKKGEVQRKAAVMQICADVANCYVMHIVHCGIPPALKSLLEGSSSVKVGLGIASDAAKISRDYNVSVEPLEELAGYANLKLGGDPKRWSLSSLTESLTCKQLEKPGKIRMGNWEVDELSKEQLQYAATDAFVSWYLHQILMTFPDEKCNSENTGEGNDAVS
ncbi:Werner Syndrome-like exonuclease [Iris pallida]|uniref:3'-5' exonuclease n=1 Tax=Iris pallida TaxID=29817 RepID=A0AAX6DL75_IRIPA|nr:Werner Syndrome-like exonuclease [Iris pallida]